MLLVPVVARADECGFLPSIDHELADLLENSNLGVCRSLTDKTRNGGKPLTLLQLEEERTKLSGRYRRSTVWNEIQLAGLNKRVDCMIVLGNFETCHCLSERLPWRISFAQYTQFVTSAPGLNAASFGITQTELSKLSGTIWSIRDQCIIGR
jgi:hypothetical protein